MTTALAKLTTDESKQLDFLETTIRDGMRTFQAVGAALCSIRDQRLYKAEFKTFEAYCRERWGFARNYANKMIGAAEAAASLGTFVPTPATESQARPLTKIKDPAEKRAIWTEAVQTAPNGKVTAAHVERVVHEHIERKETQQEPHKRVKPAPPSNGMEFANMAIMDLKQIRTDDSERKQAFNHVRKWINEHES